MRFSALLLQNFLLFLLYLLEELNSGLVLVDISHSVQKTTFDAPVERNGLSRQSPCEDALTR